VPTMIAMPGLSLSAETQPIGATSAKQSSSESPPGSCPGL
jgi:hypothetical protein